MNEKKGSSLWRRIRVYLVGVGIGTLLSIFFFKGRGCSDWTPSSRVHHLLTENVLIANDSILCKMKANGISLGDIQNLAEKGDVDFNKSKTKGKTKRYYLSGKTNKNKEIYAEFQVGKTNEIQDTISYLVGVSGNQAQCESNLNKIIHLSESMQKKIVNIDMYFLLSNTSPNQLKSNNLVLDSLKRSISSGQINSELSDPDLKPNSLFVMDSKINNEPYRFSFFKKDTIVEVIDIRKR